MRLVTLLSGLLLTGCPTDSTSRFEQCELDLVLDVTEAAPGDTVVATGRPLTDTLDTAIRVGGVDAEVLEVVVPEDACSACDSCRSTALCAACTTCADCAEACQDCVETASFVVPDLAAGDSAVTVHNAYGASPALPLQIVADTDDDSSQ